MRHLRATLLLPGMVTVLVPVTLLWLTGTDTFDLWRTAPSRKSPCRFLACSWSAWDFF